MTETVESRLGSEFYARRRALEARRVAEFCALLSPKMTRFKRKFMHPAAIMILKIFGIYSRGRLEFHSVRVVENPVQVRGLPPALNGFRIMQMSDLHIDIDPRLVSSIGAVISGVSSDVCVMTGDYRNLTVGGYENAVYLMRRLRRHISSPVYAVLGNHDTLDMVEPLERSGGYRFLLNEAVFLERAGARIGIAGTDDPYIYRTHDIAKAADAAASADIKVLLSHSPSIYADAEAAGFDVMLSGHTHGGQICLPRGFILHRNDSSPRRFWRGAWRYGRLCGYTSPGTGGCGIPVRVNCPPEITLHVLLAERS